MARDAPVRRVLRDTFASFPRVLLISRSFFLITALASLHLRRYAICLYNGDGGGGDGDGDGGGGSSVVGGGGGGGTSTAAEGSGSGTVFLTSPAPRGWGEAVGRHRTSHRHHRRL